FFDDIVASCISVPSCQLHGAIIHIAKLTVYIQQNRRLIHFLSRRVCKKRPASSQINKSACRFMTEAAAAKMIADPNPSRSSLLKYINVMITAADCAQLVPCQAFQLVMLLRADSRVNGPVRIIEQRMIYLFTIDTSYAKGNT